jgi:hypothetical protein
MALCRRMRLKCLILKTFAFDTPGKDSYGHQVVKLLVMRKASREWLAVDPWEVKGLALDFLDEERYISRVLQFPFIMSITTRVHNSALSRALCTFMSSL